jgi:hypothetical protein
VRELRLLKQYGAKRTGTCYLWHLLGRNFEGVRVLTNALGWKHGQPVDPAAWLAGHPEAGLTAEDAAGVGNLVSVKDPYAWLVSICRFEHGGRYDQAPGLVAGLNDLYAAWLGLPRLRVVRYEWLLLDLAGELGALGRQFGLRRRGDGFVDEPRVVRPGEHAGRAGFLWGLRRRGFVAWPGEDVGPEALFGRRDWYLERRYMAVLPVAARDAVTDGVDWDLFGRMGYEPCAS